jgi:RHS repeat-associated protein
VPVFYTGGPQVYVAEVAATNGTPTYANVTGQQAVSNEITLTRQAWTVTLTQSGSVYTAGSPVTLTATANQDVGATGGSYRIYIFNKTTGILLASCSTGSTCSGVPVFYTGGPQVYVAEVAATNGTPTYANVTGQQAVSNEITLTRKAWTVALESSVSAVGSSTNFTVTGTANQNVGNTGSAYRIYLLDYTAGIVLTWCATGTSCTATVTPWSNGFHTYIAVVASSVNSSRMTDIQATSNGFSAPNAGGASLPGETIGGSNPAEPLCQCSHADPVNTATGEFYLSSADIGIGGFGPALAVGRTYSSSGAAVDGPFGYGWTASFSMALRVLTPGDTSDPLPRQVQVVQESGATVVFSEDASQHYTAPQRVHATLSFDATTQKWLFVRGARQQITFNSDGSLAALSDLHGNAVTFSYTGAGQLSAMAAGGNRSLSFTWSGTRISSVTDSAGRSAQYSYDSNGNLAVVTGVDGGLVHYGYGSGHYLTTQVRPGGGVTTNVYDSQHRVTRQTDPVGRATTFAYSGSTTVTTAPGGAQTSETYSNGQLTALTVAVGTAAAATTTYTYDTASNLASVTDPTGTVTSYTYDAAGNRTSETAALGRTTIWTYDALNDQTSAIDPLGRLTSRTFSSQGDLLTSTSPGGHQRRWGYAPDGTLASATDPTGGVTHYLHDQAGNVLSTTDPDTRTTTLGYDAAGRITAITDSANHTTRLGYDAVGRVTTSTDASGHVTQYAYDSDGNQVGLTSPSGLIRARAYDAAGQLVSTTEPDGGLTSYTYTPTGRLATVTDPDNHLTSYTYDPRDNLSTSTDPDNRLTRYSYDLDGRPLTVTLPSGAVSSISYDTAGEPISTTDANGSTTLFSYDAAGQLATSTDPLNRLTRRLYTADGQPSSVVDPDASSTDYSYDAAGRLASVTDPDGQVLSYEYDPAGLLVAATQPGNLITRYSYDAGGNLDLLTRPDGSAITRTYDADGQITGVSYSGTQTPAVSYSYDADGQRTVMTDGTGTTSYSYDSGGRLTRTTDGAGATLGYSYDPAGLLDSITYPGSRTVQYSYDPAGQMTGVTDWNAHTTLFGWTADGQVHTRSDPNGVMSTIGHDPAGQRTSIDISRGGAALANYGYQYDSAGQLTQDSGIGGVQHAYTFTPAAQLNQVTTTVPGGTSTTDAYSVTPGGQLTGLPDGSTLQYNAAGQLSSLVTAAGLSTTYSYDGNGARTSRTVAASTQPSASYGYNGAGALIAAQVAGQPAIAYGIDGDGLRQSRTAGTQTRQFTWDTSGAVPLVLDDGDHSYLYGPTSTPIAQIDDVSGTVEYLHGDLLGSTALITDASGAVVASNVYDAYGNRTAHTGTADSAIGFTGEWTDPSTGLVYLRARDYDPATGQFLAIDPLVDQTLQPYAYVDGNPLQFTDPTGECLLGHSNGRCRGGGVMDGALTSGPSNWLATQLQSGAVGDVVTTFEGIGDGASFGLTRDFRNSIDPGTECFVNHNGFYFGGVAFGAVAGTVISDGSSALAEESIGGAEVAFGPAPERAWTTFERVDSKGSPFPGHKGGSMFANDGRNGSQILPRTTPDGDAISYQEWDVNPHVKGVDRGGERIVTGDGKVYYTNDHYLSFTQFWGPGA